MMMSTTQPDDVLVDDKKRVKRSISDDCISWKEEGVNKEADVVKPRHQQQLKRGYGCIFKHQLMSKTTAFFCL
jgi:hypothetical protein